MISGSGGYLFVPPGTFIEDSRDFDVFFDSELAGSVTCFANHCQGEIGVPETAIPGEHAITVEGGSGVTVNVIPSTPTPALSLPLVPRKYQWPGGVNFAKCPRIVARCL